MVIDVKEAVKPDELFKKLLKEAAKLLSKSVAAIFNNLLRQGRLLAI